jgi:hypothetical protein
MASSPTARGMITKMRGVPLNLAVKPAAIKDTLADTSGSNIFGLADAVGSPLLGATSNNTSVTDSALFFVPIPSDWVPNCKLAVRVKAKTSVARFVTATIDVTVKEAGDTLGSDICSTDAQTLSTAYVWKTFNITTTGLQPGLSVLAITLVGVGNDTGGSSDGAVSVTQLALEYEAWW